MRFLSKYGRYGVQVQHEIVEPFATGQVRILQRPIVANFEPWGMKPLERELAMAYWGGSFNGFYQEQDEVTIVPPDYRIGVFDSIAAQIENGWSDEERELVERTLTETGALTGNVLPIPETVVPPPWPRYDEFKGSLGELIERLVEDGHNLDAVLDYERGNQKRPGVIAALEGLLSNPEAQVREEEVVG